MPTYNYKCEDCSYEFSKFQKMSDNPIVICSNCNGKVRRIISGGSGMIFKGTGFYLTDYSKKNKMNKVDTNTTKSIKEEGNKNE